MVFLLALAVYWFTACPTVYVGDSGELLAAASVLGIPHPTGYPLYLLLVKGFASALPFLSFAHAGNLLSGLCAAAAAQLFAGTARRLFDSRAIGIAAGLTLAFVEPIFSQANAARTYALALLFTVLLLDRMLRWWHDPAPRHFVIFGGILGLGLANHPMVIACVPAFLLLVLMHRPAALREVLPIALAVLATLPGVGLYAYLPIRAAQSPRLDFRQPLIVDGHNEFGSLDDPARLLAYVRRDLHHEHRWVQGPRDYVHIAAWHLAHEARELFYAGAALAILGAVHVWRTGRRALVAVAAAAWLGTFAPLAWHGAWWDIFLYPRYMTSAWPGLVLLSAAGLAVLCRRFGPRTGTVLSFLLPALLLGVNATRCDKRHNTLAEDYARALFAELPPNAQFGSEADNAIFPMLYLQLAEGVRPDVHFVNEVTFADGRPRLDQPLYTPELSPSKYPRAYPRLQRFGLLNAQCPPGVNLPMPPFEEPRIWGLSGEGPLDAICASVVANVHADLAEGLALRGRVDEALAHLDRVEEIAAGRPWGYYRGIDLCLRLLIEALGRHEVDTANAHLARVRRLLALVAEHSDSRAKELVELRGKVEAYASAVAAFRALAADDKDAATTQLGRACQGLPFEKSLQVRYLNVLAGAGRGAEAERHRRWLFEITQDPEYR